MSGNCRVLVLGAGKMIEAILMGLAQTENLKDWGIYTPSQLSAKDLALKTGARFVSGLDEISRPEMVLIGCKPQQLPDLAKDLNGRFSDSLFISILAAVEEDDQLKTLKAKSLVRVMPNLSVKFREGVSLVTSRSASAAELTKVQSLFFLLGEAPVMDEASFEEITLLTGSGPALFYEFTQVLAKNFSSLDSETREKLARKVLKGAAMSASHDQANLQTMIDAVTSKGGVTIAVLEKWREHKMSQLLQDGISAGLKRTQELKNIIRRS